MKIENKVIYQVYPKSFKDTTGNGIGDLKGIISKLDYLKDLGVDYIWLSPINKSPQNDNGYDIADYYKVDPIFGTNEDYETLIKKAKEKNINIMMDLVLNHVSTEHIWFKKAIQGDKKYKNYFIFRDKPNELESAFGTSAWTYLDEVGEYYLHLFDKTQADLNWDNQDVKEEIYNMINYWIDKGVAGFRLDVIDLIGKDVDKLITARGPKFLPYLKELSENTFKDKILTVGECWNASIEDATNMSENGLMQVFHFFHINWIYPKWEANKITLNRISELINIWQNDYKGVEALVQNNHDLPRYISYIFDNTSEYRFEKGVLLLMMNIMLKGNLYIFQGEEIGMTNNYNYRLDDYIDVESKNKIKELRDKNISDDEILKLMHMISRDNARSPMQWSSTINAGFSNNKPWLKINDNYKEVNVEQDLKHENSIYKEYQKLLSIRKSKYDLIKNSTYKAKVIIDDILEIKTEYFKVLLNFSSKEIKYEDEATLLYSNYKNSKNNLLKAYEGKIYYIRNL